MPKDSTKKKITERSADPSLEEMIRVRAYAMYEERGKEDGHDLEDWLRAESELTAETARTAA
jgi:hypothetical protein